MSKSYKSQNGAKQGFKSSFRKERDTEAYKRNGKHKKGNQIYG